MRYQAEPEVLKELRRWAHEHAALQSERDELLLRARAEGVSMRDIGHALQMNATTVMNHLKRITQQ